MTEPPFNLWSNECTQRRPRRMKTLQVERMMKGGRDRSELLDRTAGFHLRGTNVRRREQNRVRMDSRVNHYTSGVPASHQFHH